MTSEILIPAAGWSPTSALIAWAASDVRVSLMFTFRCGTNLPPPPDAPPNQESRRTVPPERIARGISAISSTTARSSSSFAAGARSRRKMQKMRAREIGLDRDARRRPLMRKVHSSIGVRPKRTAARDDLELSHTPRPCDGPRRRDHCGGG